jgi:hypothetical protein
MHVDRLLTMLFSPSPKGSQKPGVPLLLNPWLPYARPWAWSNLRDPCDSPNPSGLVGDDNRSFPPDWGNLLTGSAQHSVNGFFSVYSEYSAAPDRMVPA